MAIDLNNSRPISVDDPAFRPFLEKLQGNILRGHGRDNAIYIFIKFGGDQARARAGVRALAGRVTSAHQQRRDEIAFRSFGLRGPVFCNLFLSASGYRSLGISERDVVVEKPGDFDIKSNFAEGMKAHGVELGDPPPRRWEKPYRERIDMLVLLADDDLGQLHRDARQVHDDVAAFGTVLAVEHGQALRTAELDGFEHFGYLDGRSQPIFLAEDLQGEGPTDQWDPSEPLKIVLVKDGGAPADDDAYGSLFVFRKLEQDVRGFHQKERELAQLLGLTGADQERAGAMVVGRFRDGTPLVSKSAEKGDPNGNNFRFDRQFTNRCPFHAHVRKANPRGDNEQRTGVPDRGWERDRRIARRGIPYGKMLKRPHFGMTDPSELPSRGVGLLFGCFQSSIGQQFAHIQRAWFNHDDFPDNGAGVDPLIAKQPNGTKLGWIREWGSRATVEASFGEFVTLMGGEFFFAPSLPFLSNLPNQ